MSNIEGVMAFFIVLLVIIVWRQEKRTDELEEEVRSLNEWAEDDHWDDLDSDVESLKSGFISRIRKVRSYFHGRSRIRNAH